MLKRPHELCRPKAPAGGSEHAPAPLACTNGSLPCNRGGEGWHSRLRAQPFRLPLTAPLCHEQKLQSAVQTLQCRGAAPYKGGRQPQVGVQAWMLAVVGVQAWMLAVVGAQAWMLAVVATYRDVRACSMVPCIHACVLCTTRAHSVQRTLRAVHTHAHAWSACQGDAMCSHVSLPHHLELDGGRSCSRMELRRAQEQRRRGGKCAHGAAAAAAAAAARAAAQPENASVTHQVPRTDHCCFSGDRTGACTSICI